MLPTIFCFIAVGIATSYGLDGPGIESRRERDIPILSRPALGTNSDTYTMVTVVFSGVKQRVHGFDHLP